MKIYLSSAAGSCLNFFDVRWIAFDAEADFLQGSLFHHLLGNLAILNVLEKSVHGSAGNGLTTFIAHFRWIFLVPVDHIVVQQIHHVAFTIAALGARHHHRQYQFLQEHLELGASTLVTKFVQ